MQTMRTRSTLGTLVIVGLVISVLLAVLSLPMRGVEANPAENIVRFATFNASLNRNNDGQLITDLSTPDNVQAQTVAEIIQRAAPEVLLINEFDYNEASPDEAALLFQQNYLSVSQNGAPPITYTHFYVAPSNTGVPSGFDLDNSGAVDGPNDAFGFGFFPGQYGMVVYSQYPIITDSVRTFQNFLWKDMPGALLPDDTSTVTPTDWYSSAELDVFRLSSKSHWDVPIDVNGKTIHVLVSHPTPPTFDGSEDRNGRRNHDEIRFWADYVLPGHGSYIYDDDGQTGGITPGASFVIMGDQNADPFDGDSIPGAIQQLLSNPQINTSIIPTSAGAAQQAALQGGANTTHIGNPAYDTADFGGAGENAPGNLRVDYVLPSQDLRSIAGRVFWPLNTDPLFDLVGLVPFPSSDHRLVWVDVEVTPGAETPFVTNDRAYVKPVAPGVQIHPVLTVGEVVTHTDTPGADYRMVGIPDGLGAYKATDGNVRLFMNHELGNTTVSAPNVGTTPVTVTGSLVSEYVLTDEATPGVLSGKLGFTQVMTWDGDLDTFVDATAQWQTGQNAFGRFCSAYLAGPHSGFDDYIYLNGEETSASGTFDGLGGVAVATVDDVAYTLSDMGRFSKENVVVVPGTLTRTVVLLLEDGPASLDSQLYLYIGTKNPAASTPVERAGLVGGDLYFFRSTVAGKDSELTFHKADGSLAGEWVKVQDVLQPGEQVWNLLDVTLNDRVQAAGAFNVIRVEDATYDRNDSNVTYFSTTGSDFQVGDVYPNNLGRINQLELNLDFSQADPTAGATPELTVLLEGDAGDPIVNPDNLDVNHAGQMMINEDPNGDHRGDYLADRGDASIWLYDVPGDGLGNDGTLVRVAEIDQAAVPPALRGEFGNWETSGIIDVSDIYGPGTWLFDVQAHSIDSTEASQLQGSASDLQVVEGGQLLFMQAGFVTNDQAYVKPVVPGATVKPLLTVGESVPRIDNSVENYRMVGIPDGLGAYQTEDGDVRLFMNHELGDTSVSAPIAGGQPVTVTGAIVSEYRLTGDENPGVLAGDLGFTKVMTWDGDLDTFVDATTQWRTGQNTFGRFCSAYLAGPHNGFEDYIYLNGEETSASGTFDGLGGVAVATVDGVAYALTDMGRFSKENVVVVPGTENRTVVLLLEDGPSSLDSQLYLYIGTKQFDGATAVERAGLVGGDLYFFRSTVAGKDSELTFHKADGPLAGEWVKVEDVLQPGEQVWNLLDVTLNDRVQAANAFNVIRVEDATYDRNDHNVTYFSTTGSDFQVDGVYPNNLGRINQLELNLDFSQADPTAGAIPVLTVLLEGDAGDPIVNPDNLDVNHAGQMMINEDPNGDHRGDGLLDQLGRDASIWLYDLNTDTLVRVAEIDQTAVPSALRAEFGNWETSGIIDVSNIYGPGTWLFDVQAHSIDSTEASQLQGSASDLQVVEGGQLLMLHAADVISGTMPNGVAAGDTDQDSAVLWARSTVTGTITFTYATDASFKTTLGTETATVTDPLAPVKVEITGLISDTNYYYRVTDASGTTLSGRFRTAAAVGEKVGLSFGVTGDWRGELSPYPAISNADDPNLDFFVLHGDTIYADYESPVLPGITQTTTLDEYRLKHSEVYGFRSGLNTWADVRAATSILATIDDHEVTNDFSGGAPPSTDPRFLPSDEEFINDTTLYDSGLQAFQEYNPIRDEFYGATGDDRTASERKLYRYRTYGSDAAVFVLDNRSFRDPPVQGVTNLSDPTELARFFAEANDPARTMLGQVQFEDLTNDLLTAHEAGITWKFVLVPEPMQNLGVVGAPDRFEGYAFERTRLLQFITQHGIDNVVFVAADIHGTIVNNIQYQVAPQVGPGQPQYHTGAFEITTGAAAFEEPLGPTIVDLGADLGLLSPQQVALYNALPTPELKDAFFKTFLDGALEQQGYDATGLQGAEINATLLKGSYISAHTYGWTGFDIDPATQVLTVTTYGIPFYTEAELTADPDSIINRMPEIVSQFVVTPTLVAIHDIQGAALVSPLEGETVENVYGIVTAVRSNGFYIQDPLPDDNSATSEGIFVFTNSSPTVTVGDAVRVSGVVSEFIPGGATSGNLSTTQIGGNPTIEVVSSDNVLPAPTIVGSDGRVPPDMVIDSGSSFDPANNGLDFYESLEGMLLQINDAVAVGPTSAFGEIPVVADNGANASVRSSRGGLVIRPDDFNPERIIIDDVIVSNEPAVNVGAHFTEAITGVLDYSFGNFKLLNTIPLPVVEPSSITRETTSQAGANELSVATFNVENLEPGSGSEKFEVLATQIITRLQSPDIIGLEEIQDNSGATDNGVVTATQTYQNLITAIESAGGPTYEYRQIDPQNNQDGGAPGANIRVGFLFNPERVTFIDKPGGTSTSAVTVTTTPDGATLSFNPGRIDPQNPAFAENAATGFEGTRKSLAGEFFFNGNRVFVIVNHLKSKTGDTPLFGSTQPPNLKTEAQRIAQAQVINTFVDSILAVDPQANVVVLGDMNDFDFSPPLQALKGNVLTNLIETLPRPERYSYIFDGNSQTLDHILVSNNLVDQAQIDIVHINADFAANDPARATDHDPVIARIQLAPATPRLTITPDSATVRVGETVNFTLGLTPTVPFNLIRVEFDDGTITETGLLSLAHTYNAPGTYDVLATLFADAYQGQVITATTRVVVTGEPTPPARVVVEAMPTSIPADGVSTSIITATVTDAQGNPVGGQVVTFTTTLGTFTSGATTTTATTGNTGTATVTLTAASTPGTATVVALAGSVSGSTQVIFTGGPLALNVEVNAAPLTIPADGVSTSTVTATVTNADSDPVAGAVVTFTTSLGSFSNGTSTITGTSDAVGVIAVSLRSTPTPGVATVTAQAGTDSASVEVTFTQVPGNQPASITLAVADHSISVGASTLVTATVRDASNLPVANQAVTLTLLATTGAGITPATGSTSSAGEITATLTATQPGLVIVQATTAGLSDMEAVLVTPAGQTPVEPVGAPIIAPLNTTGATTVTLTTTDPTNSNFGPGGQLVIPDGVLAGATRIIIQEIAGPTRDAQELLHPSSNVTRTVLLSFIVKLVDANGNEVGGTLNAPIIATLVYKAFPSGFIASTIALFSYDTEDGTWRRDDLTLVSIDAADRRAVFNIGHLSEFVLTADNAVGIYLPLVRR